MSMHNCMANQFGTAKAEDLHLTTKVLRGHLGPDDQQNVAVFRALVALFSTTAQGHRRHVENATELHLEEKSQKHEDQGKAGG